MRCFETRNMKRESCLILSPLSEEWLRLWRCRSRAWKPEVDLTFRSPFKRNAPLRPHSFFWKVIEGALQEMIAIQEEHLTRHFDFFNFFSMRQSFWCRNHFREIASSISWLLKGEFSSVLNVLWMSNDYCSNICFWFCSFVSVFTDFFSFSSSTTIEPHNLSLNLLM
jgi:hypothetical protein